MAWSTSELASFAGTTVNAIRHYHRMGLLPEPERRYNGYKQYGISDLVRLLRILRLVALGVPLAQIADGDAEQHPTSVLSELDEELAARIDRLRQARSDIATILRVDAPADAPAGFVTVASRLSEADRAILHIANQLYDAQALAELRETIELDGDAAAVGREIEALPADADEVSRERLAARLAPSLARTLLDHPWLAEPGAHLTKGESVTRTTLRQALAELYNPAQIDVLGRAGRLAERYLEAYGLTA